MPLAPGSRLGPYEIVAPLGAGGMGEVYKARDTRLDRTVAIKVLPAALAGDPHFRERFDREARSISSLNHPHICTLHDVGIDGDVSYLVMEYLEGDTLADRLKKGPLPLAQTLEIAIDIAEALDKAHKHGIVHRDLKPGNVMLTKSGAKLLDFGLAKAGAASTPDASLSAGPTITAGTPPLTAQGSLLGTFQYMAPEQVEGQEADARLDRWAFGGVVDEMARGKRACEGKAQASLIAAILEREPPPMTELQPMTPAALDRLVRTCLAKSPDDRFQSAHDVWLQLKWMTEGGSAAGLPAPIVARRTRLERATWLALTGAVAIISGAAGWLLRMAPQSTRAVTRFEFVLPADQTFTRIGRHVVTISPDGTRIAYVANQQLYLRPLDQLDARPIRGTNEDPVEPIFSPDGEWIAYFAANQHTSGTFSLRKVPAAGGTPVTLCDIRSLPTGVSWRSATIAFGNPVDGIVQIVPEGGGEPKTVVTRSALLDIAGQPQMLDDGRLLFVLAKRGPGGEGQIIVQAADGSGRKVLVSAGTNPRLLRDGPLIYIHEGTLLAVPFDHTRLSVTGGPVPVVDGIAEATVSLGGQFALSDSGTLVYRPGIYTGNAKRSLMWVDRTGKEAPIAANARSYVYPRLSPDGTRVAVSVAEDEQDIWMIDLAKETSNRFTFGPARELCPLWDPTSRYLIFDSGDGTNADLFRKAADGTGPVEPLTQGGTGGYPQTISPDGKYVVFRRSELADVHLFVLPLDRSSAPKTLFPGSKSDEGNADISPDGQWIAYDSNESGTAEVYVRPFPDVETGKWQISSGGGRKPVWSRSGREVYFETPPMTGNPQLASVAVQPGRPFTHGSQLPLFALRKYTSGPSGRAYDVAPDGRFLEERLEGADASTPQALHVIVNWFDDVRARVK